MGSQNMVSEVVRTQYANVLAYCCVPGLFQSEAELLAAAIHPLRQCPRTKCFLVGHTCEDQSKERDIRHQEPAYTFVQDRLPQDELCGSRRQAVASEVCGSKGQNLYSPERHCLALDLHKSWGCGAPSVGVCNGMHLDDAARLCSAKPCVALTGACSEHRRRRWSSCARY